MFICRQKHDQLYQLYRQNRQLLRTPELPVLRRNQFYWYVGPLKR